MTSLSNRGGLFLCNNKNMAEFDQLQNAMNNYLDGHDHTVDAYQTVADVMQKWEFMVALATRRALEQLFYQELPDNVIPLLRPLVAPDSAS